MKKLSLLVLLLLLSCSSFSPRQAAEKVYLLLGFSGGGTGFLVQAPSGKSFILTNAHVCKGGSRISKGSWNAPLNIVEVAKFTDLCLAEAPKGLGRGIEVAPQEPEPFDSVHIIGYGLFLGNTLTEGTWVGHLMSKVLKVFQPSYVTATVLPGNSGSPVLDDSGRLIGVVYALGPDFDNRGLLVPLKDIKEFLKDR